MGSAVLVKGQSRKMEHTLSRSFPTTQWSVVLAVANTEPARASAALQKLCARYWYPIYAFIRQRGHDAHTAEDLTQGFFAAVLARRAFDQVDRDKGRFRSFILASLNNFLFNEHDRAQALKRGGGRMILSFDDQTAEELYQLDPVDHETPEKRFERQWAAVLVRRVFDQLRDEYAGRGNAALFAGLQLWLTGEPEPGATEVLARQLGMTANAVKVALHRSRRRFGELLRREVAYTVSASEEVEAELRHLLAAIAE